MKKCYLDTNVLLCYKNEDSPLLLESKRIIKNLLDKSFIICVSPLILDEFLHSLQFITLRKKKIRNIYPLLKEILQDILKLPRLEIVNPPKTKTGQIKAVSMMENYNLRPRDAYHLLTMLENKIDIFATFDNDFRKVFKKGILKKVITNERG